MLDQASKNGRFEFRPGFIVHNHDPCYFVQNTCLRWVTVTDFSISQRKRHPDG